MNSKHPAHSKTLWFNVLTAIGTILALPILPAAVIPYIPVAQGLVNIGLRFVTDKPLSFGAP